MRLALLFLGTTIFAAEFRVGAGLENNQVYGRTIQVGGSAEGLAGKQIELRIVFKRRPVKGWDWRPIATAGPLTWTGELTSLPPGGPYRIEFRAPGAVPAVFDGVRIRD